MKLAGEWNIANAEELRKLLAESLDAGGDAGGDVGGDAGGDIVLDLAGVQACDTAALQLFYSLRRAAAERGLRLRVVALSTAIVETAAAIGLPIQELMEAGGHGI